MNSSYISVWVESFVAELDRKSCDDFRRGPAPPVAADWKNSSIFDTLPVFALLWSFVVFVSCLHLFRIGVSEGVEDFYVEVGSAESWIEKCVCFDLLSKVLPSNGYSFGSISTSLQTSTSSLANVATC